MRKIWALIAVSIAMCIPAFAQAAAGDATAKQRTEKVLTKVQEAYVKNDAAAYASLFATDGVLIAPTGKTFRGQEQVKDATEFLIKQVGGIKSFEYTIDEAHALPDGTVWAFGHATISGNKATVKDHWAAVDIAHGDELQIRMLSLGANLPPPQQARN
jgi:uncharacterized protein (TIGR02246 family)